jgi:hypothetical protein
MLRSIAAVLVSELRRHRLVLLLGGLLLALPVLADYKTDYAKGLKAAADGNWSEVDAVMREVIQQSSTPQARVRLYGQRFEAYVPQYYLGLAAYRQGDCTAAMRWFGDASAAPIISENSDLKGIADEATRECRAKLAAVKPPPTKPVQPPPVQPPAQKPVVTTPTKPVAQTPVTPTQTTPPVTTVAPLNPILQGLVDDYLAGRFSKAATADANSTPAGAARFHALLLRSASRYALFELQPVEAVSQKSAAEADIRIAKGLQPGKSPDAAFFSPRYRKFFSETR